MTDKTDREIMQQALEALYSAPLDHNSIKSRFFERRHHAIIALRERLAQPEPQPEPQPRRIALDSEALYLRAKQKAEKEAALSCPEGNKRKRLQEELTDRYFYEYTTGLSTGRR